MNSLADSQHVLLHEVVTKTNTNLHEYNEFLNNTTLFLLIPISGCTQELHEHA